MTVTSPKVSTISMTSAELVAIPRPGNVPPKRSAEPNKARSSPAASTAPHSCATRSPGTRCHGKWPRAANATVTAGFRWAPEASPIV